MIELCEQIKIESDFTDYYDCISDSSAASIYKRQRSKISRGQALKYLRSIGINTIQLKAAREFDAGCKKLVVYTDQLMHGGKGKIVVDVEEARNFYPNQLASQYYMDNLGVSIKYLQIGSLRYRLTMKLSNSIELSSNEVIGVEKLQSSLNFLIGKPIFSIDYISNGREMIATDFNDVERLEGIGLNQFIAPEIVVAEIKQSLRAYYNM